MKSNATSQYQQLVSEVLYQQLVSTDKSENHIIDTLKMELKDLKATKEELMLFSDKYAELLEEVLKQYRAKGTTLTANTKVKITYKCLEETSKWFKSREEENE